MNYQYRKTRKRYLSFPKGETCDFCDDEPTKQRAVHTTKHAYVLPNRVFYDIWELHDVVDHLMVVPKRHVHSLGELNDEELLDVMKICAGYEGQGYNIYARSKGSVRRTMHHQHTHLIKIDPKPPRVSFFLRKPWLLIKF